MIKPSENNTQFKRPSWKFVIPHSFTPRDPRCCKSAALKQFVTTQQVTTDFQWWRCQCFQRNPQWKSPRSIPGDVFSTRTKLWGLPAIGRSKEKHGTLLQFFLIWIQFNYFDWFSFCFLSHFACLMVYFNAHVFCHSVFRCILRHRFFLSPGLRWMKNPLSQSCRCPDLVHEFLPKCDVISWYFMLVMGPQLVWLEMVNMWFVNL